MAIYVYRQASSLGARELSEALRGGVRVRRVETINRRARPGDILVLWGDRIPNIPNNIRVLNNIELRSKFTDAELMKAAGVTTVEVSRTRPVAQPQVAPPDPLIDLWEDAADMAEAFIDLNPTRTPITIEGVREFSAKLSEVLRILQTPAPAAPPLQSLGEWLGRTNNHVGGNDLLRPSTQPNYFVKKENFVNEFRVHSFLGRSIRAGKKIHRDDFTNHHPWIRSWDGGWRISYGDNVGIRQAHRDIAHAAVKALGLNFGAVDIGQREDGSLVVLEVNRAPGMSDGTAAIYARAIERFQSGEWGA